MTEIVQPIPARLKNISIDGHVAGTEDIVDDAKGMTQQEINSSVEDAIGDDETEGTILGRIKALEEAGPSTGGVNKVKVGDTEYSPVDGTVSLPAYPTTLPASDVYDWAKAASKPSYTKSEVGLGNVTNDAQVKRSEMGAASGVATLDSNGKVLSSQLPSYVDDVIEGYYYNSKFYKESAHTTEITGETGKIYVDLSTNKTYRWGGSAYAVISETLALGETSSTAYRGDRGKTAYTHSQTTSGNPHNVTKSDVGLGNVGNFKAVSTEASQGLSDTEKANARANIGAGTSSFSGSYNDLSNKPTIPAAAANGTYTVKTLVGSTTTNVSDFTANQSSADDVTFVQGSNVTITPDATNRKITIAAKDTTYSSKSAASGGTDVSLVTTGEKYTWNSKTSNTGTVTKVTAGTGLTGGDITTTGTIALATSGVTAGTYKRVTVDAYGRVTSGDNTDSDTKNTAGTTNKTGTKMFLAAATEQSANPQTYSNSNCYIGTDNCLYSGGTKVLTSHQDISGKLNKSGDTMTGDLTRKCTNVDASKANNNISSTIYPTTFNILDNSNRILTRKEAIIESNGNISAFWYVRNYNTSGTMVGQKGIKITMDKSGNMTYTVNDAANFRSAIGASEIISVITTSEIDTLLAD